MCQAYEGEKNYVIASEKAKIREEYEKHKSGEKPISEERLKELSIEILMLNEG